MTPKSVHRSAVKPVPIPGVRTGAFPASAAAESRLGGVVDGMPGDTIAAFKEPDAGGHGSADGPFGAWCSESSRTLAAYTAARPSTRGGTLARMLSEREAAPPLLESLTGRAFWGRVEGSGEDLLAMKIPLPAVIGPEVPAGRRDRDAGRSIITLLIFADLPSGSRGAKGPGMLSGFAAGTSARCAALVGNRHAVEAVASPLAPPEILLRRAAGWLWQVMQGADRCDIPDRAAGRLPQLLRRASTCEYAGAYLPDHSKYAWLVVCVVPFSDPVAESLKDGGNDPCAGACGGGDRP